MYRRGTHHAQMAVTVGRMNLGGVVRAGSLLATMLTGLVVALVGTPGAAGAAALDMSACSTGQNVILAVNFSHWGGPVLRSCGSTGDTGFVLLHEGGWSTTGTGHDGPGFICRIGYSGYQNGTQYPTPADDQCIFTPPATAYWSYWHADSGQNTWSYSQLGATLYQPKAGSIDYWQFGATDIAGNAGVPAVTPACVRSGLPSDCGGDTSGGGTSSETGTNGVGGTGSGSGQSTGGTSANPPVGSVGRPPTSASTATRATASSPIPSATSNVSPMPAGSSAASPSPGTPSPATGVTESHLAPPSARPQIVDAAPAAAIKTAAGSPWPAILVGLAVLTVAGAVSVRNLRQRAAGNSGGSS